MLNLMEVGWLEAGGSNPSKFKAAYSSFVPGFGGLRYASSPILRFVLGALLLLFVMAPAQAEVFVSKTFSTDDVFQKTAEIGAGKYWVLPLARRAIGNAYEVRIESENKVYKDVTAFIADEENVGRFRHRQTYRAEGVQKGVAPFTIRGTVRTPAKHYLVIDNSYARLVDKRVVVTVKMVNNLPDAAVEHIRSTLERMYGSLKQNLVFPDFNIHVRPCGQANAFSSLTSGDIVLCTEMISRLANKPGALLGVLSHELGHTLLNLWGLPGGDNEDIADEFASVVLLEKEDGGKAIEEYAAYFDRGNAEKEAEFILRTGDRHSLSIQRIRNIRDHALHAKALFQRWNKQLYPHMTDEALRKIVAQPSANDDAALARAELARRSGGKG